MQVKHLSKESFIRLVRHFTDDLGVDKVYFSQKTPACATRKTPLLQFARIDIPLSGEKHMQFACDGKMQDVSLHPGELHYCPPLCWKLPLWDSLHEMASIVYFAEYIRFTYIKHDHASSVYEREGAHIFYHTAKPLSLEGSAVLHALDVYSESNSSSGAELPLMRALLKLSLEVLENDHSRTFGKAHVTWLRINQYLQENFYYPINREHVAENFKLNPNYISRLFAEEGNEGFNVTLRNLRMEHAALLLRNTPMSVSEICNECGYLSTTFFVSAFKKHFGVPPGKYRCRNAAAPYGSN